MHPPWDNTATDNDPMNDNTNTPPRFGRLLLVCALAVAFCIFTVWFASTYLTDCCGP
jgi:hypothetical protein